ncbi:hypothetical protein BH10ACT1_BH10ACT1_05530 [soil metagenome]
MVHREPEVHDNRQMGGVSGAVAPRNPPGSVKGRAVTRYTVQAQGP